jgi:hypothetical protein
MGRAFDQLPKSLQPAQRKKDGAAAAQDEEENMLMQRMEDPNRVSAKTNQSRGPTQQESFGRDLGPNDPRSDPRLPDEMKNRGQAFGITGPAGAEPGTRAPSTQLDKNGNSKFTSLIELLDALEAAEQEGDDEEDLLRGQGAPESTGAMHDEQPLIKPPGSQALPMREAPPRPIGLPSAHDSASYSTGDARIMHERRRAPEQRLDQHLRNHGMRSEAKRAYAVEMGRKILAQDAAKANDSTGSSLDDFLKFCPGAEKIDVL